MAKVVKIINNLDEVTCPVCLEVYEKPLKMGCGHTFCTSCMQSLTRISKTPSCPECRADIHASRAHKDKEMDRVLMKCDAKCEGCGTVVRLTEYRQHAAVCTKAKLSGSTIEKLKFKPVGETSQAPPQDLPNRQTFECPYCGVKNLEVDGLRKHCNEHHGRSREPVVCPVCAAMPWGDPNQKSSNFINHLNTRHKFEYDTYVDYQEDEDATLQRVLAESMQSS